ncbi:hypothetical protein UA08_03249 [Talaromyces atroroseus]|uniref:N-acetyltransferase domain-containing protein n=1 Tax=Talaromyces atroroseus TaxID=1441469 RepID=A0A225AS40_TALAT|nr:hypothetical protein UA08_03249 [Talaromyces atroroseus]OKL61174.1 hypothetical protein UA08_03249 [Talaromyces atroroseus]
MDAPANHPVDTLRSTNMGDTSLEKRYDFTNSPYICNGDELGYATSKDIERGVKYLHGVKGKPVNEAGKCGRNDFTLTLDSFGDIADGVRYLETKCNVYNDETGVNIAGEVRNEDDNWTVINKPQYTFRTALHPPQCISADTTTLIYPTPTNPSPANNHPVFTDAMSIRHQVFVVEQHCSADAEIDEDDPRSWEWVVYAQEQQQQQEEEEIENKIENPVGVIRLVPPPHAPHHDIVNNSYSSNTEPSPQQQKQQQQKFDYQHEPYVKITRVAILKEFRGYGLARLLMRVVEEWAQDNKASIDGMYMTTLEDDAGNVEGRKEEWKGLIGLHAQAQVEKMYASLGYETDVSMGTWDEEGIEHVGMFKRVDILV